MIHVILSPIGLLLYWPVAVFIVHAKTQHSFDPPTEAIVCNSLHPRPKPCGLWDICQILLDQRMTITQTGVHIPPTAALEVSWPLSTGKVEKHRWFRGYILFACDSSICCSITFDIVKCSIHKFIKHIIFCCSLAFLYFHKFFMILSLQRRVWVGAARGRGSAPGSVVVWPVSACIWIHNFTTNTPAE